MSAAQDARLSRGALVSVLMITACSGTSDALPEADAAVTPAPAVVTGGFRATGNEPGWRLDITGSEMSLLTNLGQDRLVAVTPPAQVTGDTTTYVARTAEGEMTVTIIDRLCVDNMSGMPHPQTVTVQSGGRTLHGCGGEPASLLRGAEWTVTRIGTVPAPAEPRVTLEFGADGRVTGKAPCNRFSGRYALTGEGLGITEVASTRMACPAPLMQQEQEFFAALAAVRGFSIPAAGRLLLQSGDGRDVEARRP
jgi:heat shock protein HslJ